MIYITGDIYNNIDFDKLEFLNNLYGLLKMMF